MKKSLRPTLLTFLLTGGLVLFVSCNNSGEKLKNEKDDISLILGERIDGPANIRDTVNGKILFSLNDNVVVETAPQENSWLVTGLYVKLTAKQLDDFKIFPGSNLISSDARKIGKTHDTVNIEMAFEEDSIGMIAGYTHAKNIKPNSIPENVLSNLINQENTSFQYYKELIRNFKFKQEDYNLPELKQYFIYESSVVDPSPRDRMSLLFDKSEKLICIVHSRPIKTNQFKTYPLVRGHMLTIIADLDSNEIKNIKDKRIAFYNSVD